MSDKDVPPDLAKPPILPQGASGWLWLAAKIAISVAILAVALSRMDFTRVAGVLTGLSPLAFIVGLAAMAGANCLGGFRWSVLTGRLEARIPPGDAIGMYVAALFAGQVLPSSLGVDAVRAWLASRRYKPLSQVVSGIVLDRAFGLIALGLLLLFAAPRLLTLGDARIEQAAALAMGLLALAVIGGVAAIVVFLRMRLTGRLAMAQDLARTVLAAVIRLRGVGALAISLAVHGLLVTSVAAIAASLNAPIGPLDALATVPAAMLIAAIPISINGWGLREGAMIACLALAGVPAEVAFAVSILFGIGQFIVAIPGGAYWIFARKAPAR